MWIIFSFPLAKRAEAYGMHGQTAREKKGNPMTQPARTLAQLRKASATCKDKDVRGKRRHEARRRRARR